MSAVSFSEGNEQFDITPVENVFILEYMSNAPGDFVKVYLRGLNMCYNNREDYSILKMAKALSLSKEEVEQAFTYWAQLELITIVSKRPYEVEYHNIKKIKMQKADSSKGNLYTHQPLVLELQRIFGGRRLLGTSEVNYIIIWLDEWKVAPEVVSLVAAWCVEMKGSKVRFSYINKVMGDIYDQNLNTYSQVEAYIKDVSAKRSGASDVLKAWNLNRPPTADEITLYRTWTTKFGVNKDIIREVQKHMTGISNPSFKALDTMINRLNKNSIKNLSDTKKYYYEQDNLRTYAKEVYLRLGGLRVTDSRIEQYASWRKLGFSQHGILLAADALAKEGDRQPADLDSVLKRWHKNGISDDMHIDKYMKEISKTSKLVSSLLEKWGDNRAPKKYELSIYNTWIQKKYSKELIALACKKSESAKNKMAYASKVLSIWAANNIKTIAQAKKQYSTFGTSKKEKDLPDDDYLNLHNSWEEI